MSVDITHRAQRTQDPSLYQQDAQHPAVAIINRSAAMALRHYRQSIIAGDPRHRRCEPVGRCYRPMNVPTNERKGPTIQPDLIALILLSVL